MATSHQPHLDLESGAGAGPRDNTRLQSGSPEIVGAVPEEVEEKGRKSSVSEFSVVDLENSGAGGKAHLLKTEKDCRICHLNNEESGNGVPIELGCSCKDDLAAAHKQCAEAWFKIKGNRTCEICGSIARNVAGSDESEPMNHWNDPNDATSSQATRHGQTTATPETQNFWQGHRFLNFLLASMVFAFVISWLFHFNVPS